MQAATREPGTPARTSAGAKRDEPERPAPPDRVLALQQSAGNHAVAQLLARTPTKTPGGGVTDVAELDRLLAQYLAAEDWGGMAWILLRYADDQARSQRLFRLSVAQIMLLTEHMRVDGEPSPSPGPLHQLIEWVQRQKLDAEYPTVVDTGNLMLVTLMLKAYDQPELMPRARTLQRRKGPAGVAACRAMATQWWGDDHRVARVLAFFEHEEQTGPAARPIGPGAPMTEGPRVGPAVAVPGGKVSTYENAKDLVSGDGWFGLAYEGENAQNTGWLQFAARETEMFDARGTSLGFETETEIEVLGQDEIRIPGTRDAPRWYLDARGDESPFYESSATKAKRGADVGASGAHRSWEKETSIWDAPDFSPKVFKAAFAADLDEKVAKAVQRTRFHMYLVRGMDVLYENTMVVEFTAFSPTGPPQRKNIAGGTGGAATRIHPEHHAALVRRFPGWTFYRHAPEKRP